MARYNKDGFAVFQMTNRLGGKAAKDMGQSVQSGSLAAAMNQGSQPSDIPCPGSLGQGLAQGNHGRAFYQDLSPLGTKMNQGAPMDRSNKKNRGKKSTY
jgi:hypothetical protein